MSVETARIIKDAQERIDNNVLKDLVYNPGGLETIRYVCSMDGEYAISPEEFLAQAAQTGDEYEHGDGFEYVNILPTDIALIHEDGTTDLIADELRCGRKWVTVPAYRNGKEVAEDARTMSEEGRKAFETLIGGKLDDITGLGVWRVDGFINMDMEEGPITPSALLNHMSAKNRRHLDGFAGCGDCSDISVCETGDDEYDDIENVEELINSMQYDFTVSFKDGSRIAVIPFGMNGDWPVKMPVSPKRDAKPFQPFHLWDGDFATCAEESSNH